MMLNALAAKNFLVQIGFVQVTDRPHLMTNPDSKDFGQVIVSFEPTTEAYEFDASKGLNVPEFLNWWDARSASIRECMSLD